MIKKNNTKRNGGENLNAWIHAILSFLIPGLGQACSKKYFRATAMFLIAVLIFFKWFGNSLIGNIVPIIYALVVADDAFLIAASDDEAQ